MLCFHKNFNLSWRFRSTLDWQQRYQLNSYLSLNINQINLNSGLKFSLRFRYMPWSSTDSSGKETIFHENYSPYYRQYVLDFVVPALALLGDLLGPFSSLRRDQGVRGRTGSLRGVLGHFFRGFHPTFSTTCFHGGFEWGSSYRRE